jgi:hypothetical protein
MAVLTLNIEFKEKGLKKTIQFEPGMVVYDACRIIREKVGAASGNRKLLFNEFPILSVM